MDIDIQQTLHFIVLNVFQADVILNTTTSFPYLNGAVPNALCRQGGQSIRDECQQYNGKADNGDIIETKAGNLQCQSLFHYVLPDWDQLRGAKVVTVIFYIFVKSK